MNACAVSATLNWPRLHLSVATEVVSGQPDEHRPVREPRTDCRPRVPSLGRRGHNDHEDNYADCNPGAPGRESARDTHPTAPQGSSERESGDRCANHERIR